MAQPKVLPAAALSASTAYSSRSLPPPVAGTRRMAERNSKPNMTRTTGTAARKA
jgi:hypothetical protein